MASMYYSPDFVNRESPNFRQDVYDRYQSELREVREFKNAGLDKHKSPFVLSDVVAIKNHLRTIRVNKPSDVRKQKKTARGNHITLQTRLENLKPGSYIDVDNMKKDGKGAKTMNKDPPSRNTKKMVANVPNVPRIVASNVSQYRMAMEMLGEEYVRFAEEYENGNTIRLGELTNSSTASTSAATETTSDIDSVTIPSFDDDTPTSCTRTEPASPFDIPQPRVVTPPSTSQFTELRSP